MTDSCIQPRVPSGSLTFVHAPICSTISTLDLRGTVRTRWLRFPGPARRLALLPDTVAVLIVGDFFFGKGEAGIGQRILRYSSDLRGEELLTAVIMSSVLGVSVFVLFGWIQTRATGKWHEAAGV